MAASPQHCHKKLIWHKLWCISDYITQDNGRETIELEQTEDNRSLAIRTTTPTQPAETAYPHNGFEYGSSTAGNYRQQMSTSIFQYSLGEGVIALALGDTELPWVLLQGVLLTPLDPIFAGTNADAGSGQPMGLLRNIQRPIGSLFYNFCCSCSPERDVVC